MQDTVSYPSTIISSTHEGKLEWMDDYQVSTQELKNAAKQIPRILFEKQSSDEEEEDEERDTTEYHTTKAVQKEECTPSVINQGNRHTHEISASNNEKTAFTVAETHNQVEQSRDPTTAQHVFLQVQDVQNTNRDDTTNETHSFQETTLMKHSEKSNVHLRIDTGLTKHSSKEEIKRRRYSDPPITLNNASVVTDDSHDILKLPPLVPKSQTLPHKSPGSSGRDKHRSLSPQLINSSGLSMSFGNHTAQTRMQIAPHLAHYNQLLTRVTQESGETINSKRRPSSRKGTSLMPAMTANTFDSNSIFSHSKTKTSSGMKGNALHARVSLKQHKKPGDVLQLSPFNGGAMSYSKAMSQNHTQVDNDVSSQEQKTDLRNFKHHGVSNTFEMKKNYYKERLEARNTVGLVQERILEKDINTEKDIDSHEMDKHVTSTTPTLLMLENELMEEFKEDKDEDEDREEDEYEEEAVDDEKELDVEAENVIPLENVPQWRKERTRMIQRQVTILEILQEEQIKDDSYLVRFDKDPRIKAIVHKLRGGIIHSLENLTDDIREEYDSFVNDIDQITYYAFRQAEEVLREYSPRTVLLISSAVAKPYQLESTVRPGVLTLVYNVATEDYTSLLAKVNDLLNGYIYGAKAKYLGIVCKGGPGYMYLLKKKPVTPAKLMKDNELLRFWNTVGRYTSKISKEQSVIYLMESNVAGNRQGEELLLDLEAAMFAHKVNVKSPVEFGPKGREMIGTFFLPEKFKLWKTNRYSKIRLYK